MANTGKSTANKRTEKQILADLLFIEQCVIEGMSCQLIAAELAKERPYTLSRQQIQVDVKKVLRLWHEERIELRDHLVAAELAGMKYQERELHVAWKRSFNDTLKKTAEVAEGSKKTGKPSKQKVESQSQCGDPRYMALILEIRKQRREMLGLDKPVKHELSGPEGAPLKVVHVDEALEKAYGDQVPKDGGK